MSAGKLSGLWSGQPNSVKLDELEIFCAVLDCGPEDLLIREPGAAQLPGREDTEAPAASQGAAVRPRRPQRRTLPPA